MRRVVRGPAAFPWAVALLLPAALLSTTTSPTAAAGPLAPDAGSPGDGSAQAAATAAAAASSPGTPLTIAHAGGALQAPKNTVAAFRTAVRNGADMLELDVRQSADGVPVVRHDDTVDATTDGSGRVDELTVAELAELDAAHWFVPGCGACHDREDSAYTHRGFATGDRRIPDESELRPGDFRIPTLERVLRTFPDTPLTIELKDTGDEAAVADLLQRYDRSEHDTIVTSFHDEALDRFAEHDPGVGMAPGPATVAAFAAATLGPLPGMPLPGYEALQVPRELDRVGALGSDFVEDAHRHELEVHVWTVNEPAEMRRLLDLEVDGIMTDRPSVLADVIAERSAG